MSEVVSLTLNDTALSQFTKKLDALKTKTKAAGKQLQTFADKTQKLTAITKVAEATKKYAKESIAAAQMQVKNETQLALTLKQRTNATKGQINSILKLTSAQQANGVVSDDVQMAGAEQLATYASNTDSIKTLIPAMNNLLVTQKGLSGTAGDAASVADLMGKGLQGQTAELEKAGVAFSDAQKQVLQYGSEEEKAAVLAQAINDKVEDANKEMANTDVGAIAEAKNLFLDLKESIGKKILPYLAKFAKWFSKNEPAIKTKILSIIDTIVTKSKPVFTFLKKLFKTIKNNQKIVTIISIFVGAIVALAAAISIVNFVLGLCPLVWIVAGIALVIAAIAAVILYWDVLKAAAANVWESITTYFGNLKDSVVEKFSAMVEGIKELWQSAIDFLKNPIKGIIDLVSNSKTNSETSGAPSVEYNALGTSYWKGGLTHINERGGEIVDLPNGSRVIPADKSDRLLSANGVSIGNIYITAKGVTASEVVNEIVPRLKLSLANM